MRDDARRILVVAAHPDDEVLGCGGTLLNLAKSGAEISTMFMADGETSRNGAGIDEIEAREAAARKVARIMGTLEPSFCRLKDNSLDKVSLLKITKLIHGKIIDFAPDTIFTHSNCDLNLDHRLVFQATLTAARPMKKASIKRLYSFEIPSSTEWAFGRFSDFSPSMFVDVTTVWAEKMEVLQCYGKEILPAPHPRSEENVTALAKIRGASVGVHYAEAFETIFNII